MLWIWTSLKISFQSIAIDKRVTKINSLFLVFKKLGGSFEYEKFAEKNVQKKLLNKKHTMKGLRTI